MLTWEYPPVSVGGLGNHVYCLSKFLSQDIDIDIVTIGNGKAPAKEQDGRVTIYRATEYPIRMPDFATWVMQLNMALAEKAIDLAGQRSYSIIHAHDWLVAYAARMVKVVKSLPLVATIHATEAGRNQGLHNDLQHYINSVEWWLTYEAWRVIVCSNHMFHEVKNQFQLPEDKINIIPNGIDATGFQLTAQGDVTNTDEALIFFVGRLVREKGSQILLEAMPQILTEVPGARLVIAGKGPMRDELVSRAYQMGLADKVDFPGFIDDETRNRFYRQAAAAVFPSLYEPFGIVALEGMAGETPVVVSDTGGLGEIVIHGVNGLKALPGNPDSLAANIVMLLNNRDLAEKLVDNASRLIRERYDWRVIARDTAAVYRQILSVQNDRLPSKIAAHLPDGDTDKAGAYQLRSSLMAQRLNFRKGEG